MKTDIRTISFYNERGGVGKTSFSILYASWLRYKHGVKVTVIDLDNRIQLYRNLELVKTSEQFEEKDRWPIVGLRLKDIQALEQRGEKHPYALWLSRKIAETRDNQVIIIDYPPQLYNGIIETYVHEMIDLTIIPIEYDPITVQSTKRFIEVLENAKLNYRTFINKAEYSKRKHDLDILNTFNSPNSTPLCKIGYYPSFGETSFRSTLFYPKRKPGREGVPGIHNLYDGLENLFIKVTKELKKSTTALSFINNIDVPDATNVK